MRERLCRLLLRLTARLEEWLWARYRTPELPYPLEANTPTRRLTALRIRHHAFHSVQLVGSRMWRVRLHLPDGTVRAATAHTIDEAIELLVASVKP